MVVSEFSFARTVAMILKSSKLLGTCPFLMNCNSSIRLVLVVFKLATFLGGYVKGLKGCLYSSVCSLAIVFKTKEVSCQSSSNFLTAFEKSPILELYTNLPYWSLSNS